MTKSKNTTDSTALRVGDCMAPFPFSLAPDASLSDARYLMNKQRIRHLPVLVDGELVGVVTRTDLLEAEPSDAIALKVWEQQHLLEKLTVQQIMTLHPVTVTAATTLVEAARLMLDRKIGCLPVVDENRKLRGLLTETDILRALVDAWTPA
jgi:CBS domain-containing protein